MAGTLIEMLRSTADHVGDKHGIRFYETQSESGFLGYSELDGASRAIGAAFAERGLVPGDVVVIALNSGFEFVQAVYGAFYAGLAIAPTAVSGTAAPDVMINSITRIVDASGARLIVTQEAVLDKVREPYEPAAFAGVPVVTVAELLEAGVADNWTEPAIDESALAALLFTSGSTGDPKGVIHTHATLLASMEVCTLAMQGTRDSVIVGWMPFHHAFGLAVQLLYPVHLGASAVLTSTEQFQRRPVFWLQLISKHRATMSAAANFAFGLCTQFATDEQIAELDLSSLQVISNGSEPVRTETIHAFLDRFASTGVRETMIAPALGTSESMLVTIKPLGRKLVVLDVDAAGLEAATVRAAPAGDRSIEMVSCGVACPLCEVAIVDPSTEMRLPDGRVGEIWLSSPATSPGYWHRPEASAEAFGAKLAGDQHEYNRTGDLGAVIGGELFITGRRKDLIIVRGRNIYPQDIEAAAIRVHPAVGTGTAFELVGHPAEVGVVLECDADALPCDSGGLAALAIAVHSALTHEFSLPSLAIAFVPPGELPRTAIGKVKRAFTRSMLEYGQLRIIYASGFAPQLQQAGPSAVAR